MAMTADTVRRNAKEIGADGSGYDIGDLICVFVKEQRHCEERKTMERTLDNMLVFFAFLLDTDPSIGCFRP